MIVAMLLAALQVADGGDSVFRGQTTWLPSIEGKTEYLDSPFVAAGDRVYVVGYQDGTFPDLGWHIGGEMGGIWDHPIKLMDGFAACISLKGGPDPLRFDHAEKFTNYPVANLHRFTWPAEKLSAERLQFVPDGVEGLVVEFRIANHGDQVREMVFSFTGMVDLLPTWLGDASGMKDAPDELSYDKVLGAVIAKDSKNPWFAAFASTMLGDFAEEAPACNKTVHRGQGKSGTLSFPITLKPGEEKSIPFFIAGSYKSEAELRATLQSLRTTARSMLARKIERYGAIDAASRVTLPDKAMEQMYRWMKYNVDWLVRDVPEQGRGISAGLPDYPFWFGSDSIATLRGSLMTGDHALARSTILLLDKFSKRTNGNGRMIHEVSTNGVSNGQGVMGETMLYVDLLRLYLAWTGDLELIRQLFPEVRNGMAWLKSLDSNGNGFPNGQGGMEIPGLDAEMVDSAAWMHQALDAACDLAQAVGEDALAAEYRKSADDLKMRINRDYWNEEAHSFADFIGTPAEARPIIEVAIKRAEGLKKAWAVAEMKETWKKLDSYPSDQRVPWVVYHNFVVNTPMETGVADLEKGRAALRTSRLYENHYGVYISGIDAPDPENRVLPETRHIPFTYVGSTMPTDTGMMAIAAMKYGTTEDVQRYLTMIQRSFNYALPGSMYEMAPDAGMCVQAFNIYGVAVPIVGHFFGVQPRAVGKTVRLSPHLPVGWKTASIDRVKVGANLLSLDIRQEGGRRDYRIRQTLADWTVAVDVAGARRVSVDGKDVDLKTVTGGTLAIQGADRSVCIE